MVELANALDVGRLILTVNERYMAYVVLGIIFLGVLIARPHPQYHLSRRESRRNKRQASFLNAVTHELNTPMASVRLVLHQVT